MPPTINASPNMPAKVDVLAVPVFSKLNIPADAGVELDKNWLKARGFEAKPCETAALLADDGSTVVAVGLGDAAKADLNTYRRAAAAAVRAAGAGRHLAIAFGGGGSRLDAAAVSQAIAEGASLATYRYTEFKSDPKPSRLNRVTIVGGDPQAVALGARIAAAVALTRDLVNGPPDLVTPERLAEVATEIAETNGLTVEIWDEQRIEEERLGGLRGVSLGSDRPPRLIRLVSEPANGSSRGTVALVGKGITFDSGGLSIKTGEGMMTMKTDMSGAAAVLGAMSVVREVAPDVRVIGYAACTENLPSGSAIKPGDVLRFRNGKTAEILNTDAEGRLVLADALSLAVEDQPDAIVDLATLTGAVVVALGKEISGVMGTDPALVEQVKEAGERAGEPVWELPLPDAYKKHIESEIADIKNIGATGQAGTISAGLFLKEFVADVPWAHLDIAGTARAESDDGYLTKGGTGVGVRTVLELLRNFGLDTST